MQSYNFLERFMAKALDSFPGIKKVLKLFYSRIMYVVHRKKRFKYKVHPLCELKESQELASNKSFTTNNSFFGYYDKSPWSNNMDKYLIHSINSMGEVDIIVIDIKNNRIKKIDTSKAWNYQQGSMLQWIPNTNRLIFNKVSDRKLISQIIELDGECKREISFPVQSIHPNGKYALTLNYKRLFSLKPEYGYRAEVVNYHAETDLKEDGIFVVDLEKNQVKLLITLEYLKNNLNSPDMDTAKHKVNHIIYSKTGKRFVFMHRWISSKGKFSRLYVADSNGENLKILLDDRMISHYQWRDDENLIVWGRTKEHGDKYYLINTVTGDMNIIGNGVLDDFGDGHPSFSPDGNWIVTDSYPNKARIRNLHLFNLNSNELVEIGCFFAPWKYDGEKRCDLHPRWSPDGKYISIDSAHEGIRKNYVIDVSKIVEKGRVK